MNFIKKIFKHIINIFKRKKETPMLEEGKVINLNKDRTNFLNSLKMKQVFKKKKVETLVCDGDGLGIQNKMDY